MQKLLTSILIFLFILCGFYALYDTIAKPKPSQTSNFKVTPSLIKTEALKQQERKENLDSLPYDYKVIDDKVIFLPTWNNIFNMITMPEYLFKDLMTTYSYAYDQKNNSYFKVLENTKAEFTVNREREGSLLLLWKNIELSTNELEQQLKNKLTLVQKDKFIQTYEYKKQAATSRISIAKTGNSNFVAFDILEN